MTTGGEELMGGSEDMGDEEPMLGDEDLDEEP